MVEHLLPEKSHWRKAEHPHINAMQGPQGQWFAMAQKGSSSVSSNPEFGRKPDNRKSGFCSTIEFVEPALELK